LGKIFYMPKDCFSTCGTVERHQDLFEHVCSLSASSLLPDSALHSALLFRPGFSRP
jgi:hypothetical protein